MEQLPNTVRVAYIFNPQLSTLELLQSICDELQVDYPGSCTIKHMYQILNDALLAMYASGERVICLIDEAQSMPAPLLEQIRLLTNLETSTEKLMTLILVGQPELNELLNRHEMRQLRQRITARFHLNHLGVDECYLYLSFRLQHAGCDKPVFSKDSAARIWKAAGGVPRLINSIADRVLLGVYAKGFKEANAGIVKQAIKEVVGQTSKSSVAISRVRYLALALPMVIIIASAPWVHSWLSVNTTDSSDTLLTDANPVRLLSSRLNLNADSCDGLETSTYRCLWVDWSLEELSLLSPMAMIQVKHHLDGKEEWISVPDYRRDEMSYRGKALLLWQQPEEYDRPIKPGESSAVVVAVRKMLGKDSTSGWQVIAPAGREHNANVSRLYDPLLASQVQRFQQKNGLVADQIIGPKTLIVMQREALAVANPVSDEADF